MNNFKINQKSLYVATGAIISFMVIVLLLLPPEEELGNVIKVVFVHAALVQTGLLIFLVAGLQALIGLLGNTRNWLPSISAVQKTSLVIWTLYILSSTIVTKLAWGIWIAWEEPRVTASIAIWLTAILFYVLVLWIADARFTAAANLIFATAALWLAKSSGTIRHPNDPIGGSNSALYKIIFLVVLISTLVIASLLTIYFRIAKESKKP